VPVFWSAGLLHKMKFRLEGGEPGECRCKIETGEYSTSAKWDECPNPVHGDRRDGFDARLVRDTERLVLHPGDLQQVPILADSSDGLLIFSGWWFGRQAGYSAGPLLTPESEVSITLRGTNLNWTRKFSVQEIVCK